MLLDRRDLKELRLTLWLSERQYLKTLAVAKRRGGHLSAIARDLLMEAVAMDEHLTGDSPTREAAPERRIPFNFKKGALCRSGNPSSPRLPLPSASGLKPSPQGEDSRSMRP